MHFDDTEIAFDVPDDWVDVSMTTFVFPEAATSLTLTKAAPTQPTLEAQGEEIVTQLEMIFPELEVLHCAERDAGATRAVHVAVEWQAGQVRLQNRIAFLLHQGALWSLSASTPTALLDETGPAIDRALASFRAKPAG